MTIISSVQSLSHVQLFVTPWIATGQASLSITNSWSSTKLMSIESVMPSSHLILCRPLLLLPPIPASIRVFPMSQLFAWWIICCQFRIIFIPILCNAFPRIPSLRMALGKKLPIWGMYINLKDQNTREACCDSWGRKESDTTEWLNWTELNWTFSRGKFQPYLWAHKKFLKL